MLPRSRRLPSSSSSLSHYPNSTNATMVAAASPCRGRRQRRDRHRPIVVQQQLHLLLMLCLFCSLLTTANAHLRGQLSPAELAQRQRQHRLEQMCAPDNLEFCGAGEGVLVCEYDERYKYFATRCVKKDSFSKHVGLHSKNYCGACHKCFQNSDELQSAVQRYIQNGTQETTIARIYGWPIGQWCVDSVTDFSHLFSGLNEFNEDIGSWDVQRATNMEGMFLEAFQFDQDLSDWNVSKVTDMSLMFDRAYAFEGHGLSKWDTSRVTNFQRMFRIAKHFQADLRQWDTSRSTDLSLMFYRAERYNQPMNDWNVAKVTDMSYTFAFAKAFNQTLSKWDTSGATTIRGMFQSADSFAQDLSGWDVQRVTDMSFMFSNAHAFDEYLNNKNGGGGDALLKSWNLKSVEYQDQMFGVISPVFNQTISMTNSVLTDLQQGGQEHTSSY